jgi:hypothetical protein
VKDTHVWWIYGENSQLHSGTLIKPSTTQLGPAHSTFLWPITLNWACSIIHFTQVALFHSTFDSTGPVPLYIRLKYAWSCIQKLFDFLYLALFITGRRARSNYAYLYAYLCITYVKDETSNLNTMITTIKPNVSYDMLGLEESFQGACFRHAFSKACQYVTIEEKVCKDLQYVLINFVQGNLQKCITWSNFFGKGR